MCVSALTHCLGEMRVCIVLRRVNDASAQRCQCPFCGWRVCSMHLLVVPHGSARALLCFLLYMSTGRLYITPDRSCASEAAHV